MAGLRDASKAHDRFQSTVAPGLLTKEERRLEALRKGAEQADRELANATKALAAQMERVQRLEREAAQRLSEYESAKSQEAP